MKSRVITLLAALTVVACDAAYSTHPVGTSSVSLEQKHWDGIWVGKQAITVRASSNEKGVLRLAWVGEKDGAFVLESTTAHLMSTGDWTF